MTLSSLAVGSLELEPSFNPEVFEYTVDCGEPQQGVDSITVSFETTEPDAETYASYSYQGGGGAVPIYIWDEPPYTFSAWDCPGLITIMVKHGGQEKTYKVHTVNAFSATP